ncbi:SWIM zinc finger family protein [Paenibacillus beijingensis]|uniref:SWIM-type domain-containing protein n=1 Tax=Paenibacillus beijingensis TaxID=1126833 RepID=A0A0D5NDW7_9BACL|nr:SWIM zinc finger family protein [Paenibacillus beijingensis]AJY73594.1 hypothetical protein VN24_01815 [Paenibacillus beijingensis]
MDTTTGMSALLPMLEEQLMDELPSVMIERGWNYFRKEKASGIRLAGDHTLEGIVRGSDLYAVTLDAQKFTRSVCTCPYGGYCKHMAAVFFAAYELEENGAQEAYERLMGLEFKPYIDLRQTAAASDGPPQAMPPGLDAAPEEWERWMSERYGETWRQCRHSLHALQPVLSALKGSAKMWPKSSQRLHWMNAILFVLMQAEKAITTVDAFSRYYQEMSFTRMAEPWIEHYETLIRELEPEAMNERERGWRDWTCELLHDQASSGAGQLFRWDYFYFTFADKLDEDRRWRVRERKELERRLRNARGSEPADASPGNGAYKEDKRTAAPTPVKEDSGTIFALAALARLDASEGNDADAIANLRRVPFENASLLAFKYANIRTGENEWGKLEGWMEYLFGEMGEYRNSSLLQPFLLLCRNADLRQPDNPSWQTYMIRLLPFAYGELADHWLDRGRYTEWADLQLTMGIRPDELDNQDIRIVAKSAPAVLVPLYHHAVEEWISTRNRQGYRMAVKQLKKLEKLYKADKKSDRFEHYTARLARKYQRMRALQEELWKGNILK